MAMARAIAPATIPARSQADVRELLLSTERWGDVAETREASLAAADQAGLLACGDLGQAVRVAVDGALNDEAALTEALASGRAASLVRFAFGRLAER